MAIINPDVRNKVKGVSRNPLTPYPLQLKPSRGFALLIAVIFMSVMLSLGLALSSLGYKQQLLASTAIESQYAFYAADAGMECALYADQQLDSFDYASSTSSVPNTITCDGNVSTNKLHSYSTGRSGLLYDVERLDLDTVNGATTHCADVTVYKHSDLSTQIFSQGYDVPCSMVSTAGGTRFVSRGESISY
jgi:hypothetical protein